MINKKLIVIITIVVLVITFKNLIFPFFKENQTINKSKAAEKIDNGFSNSTVITNDVLSENNCQSSLYVSDIASHETEGLDVSLKNLFIYFSKKDALKSEVRSILINSNLVDATSIEYASILFEPPPYLAEKNNSEQLKVYFEQINQFDNDYNLLAAAIENGDLDANLDLALIKGYPVSIIDYVINSKTDNIELDTLKRLVHAGVIISPETIFQALKSNVSIDKLIYLFDQLNSSQLYYKRDDIFGHNYDFISYASIFSSIQSLEFILSRVDGQQSNALNNLISNFMEESFLNTSLSNNVGNLTELQKRKENFNQKLTILINYNVPIEKEMAKKLLEYKSILSSENFQLLSAYSNYVLTNNALLIDKKLESDVLIYLNALKQAHKSWPEFIFSYDPDCKKIPNKSHYRYHNLRARSEMIELLNTTQKSDNDISAIEIPHLEDIYIDWILYSQTEEAAHSNTQLSEVSKQITVSDEKDEVIAIVMDNIILKRWDEIEKIITKNTHVLSVEFRKNTYLIDIGIEFNIPEEVLFTWLDLGAKIQESALESLVLIENYAKFTYELIKKKRLINKSHKSIIFQAAKAENLELLKLLTENVNIVNNNKGVSAFSWTLLNYNEALADQLKLLKRRDENTLK